MLRRPNLSCYRQFEEQRFTDESIPAASLPALSAPRLAHTASSAGDAVVGLARVVAVYEITGSARGMGIVLADALLPNLIFPLAGAGKRDRDPRGGEVLARNGVRNEAARGLVEESDRSAVHGAQRGEMPQLGASREKQECEGQVCHAADSVETDHDELAREPVRPDNDLGSLVFMPVGFVTAGVLAGTIGPRSTLLLASALFVAPTTAILAVPAVRALRDVARSDAEPVLQP